MLIFGGTGTWNVMNGCGYLYSNEGVSPDGCLNEHGDFIYLHQGGLRSPSASCLSL